MEFLNTILTAFGLSSSAGLNAYIPLLLTGILARYTDLITLNPPYDVLEHPLVLTALGVLLIIEMLADKIAAVDTVNDIIHTLVRPAAGAILFAASTSGVIDIHPAFAVVLGLIAAGSVHAAKATARPLVTATTGGLGNPIVSTIEDIVSFTVALLAILVPIIAIVMVAVIAFWLLQRRRRQPAPTL